MKGVHRWREASSGVWARSGKWAIMIDKGELNGVNCQLRGSNGAFLIFT